MRSVTRPPRLRAALAATFLGLALTAGLAPLGLSSRAAAADFPSYDSRYHSYDEMVAELTATEAAYQPIVDVFSIGKTVQNRDIWAAKISDNVATDEPEPEIMFDALHHAREHMTLEQALYLLRLLSTGYNADERITRIVNQREIWIVFAVNPDGAEHDLTCRTSAKPPYCAWRKNRQPTPGSSYVGTDLNRNYDYRWGCCGGSSGNPASITYRGWKAFSAPESLALRNFVNSRVVEGRQQIVSHITFHTNGELILWPYGYTYADVPADMTQIDRDALATFARRQAALNGYRAQQSSQLYVTDGDQIDWMYGRHRIFSYTWELYPPETATVWGDHYPQDEHIAPQTARNKAALLYFLERGACPYAVLGSTVTKTHCGPFMDDLEISRGWVRNPYGTDTARAGMWERGDPSSTSLSGRPKQLGTTTSGRYAMVTGLKVGTTASANDLDGGTTIVRSAPITLPAVPGNLTFRWFFGTAYSSTTEDSMRAYIEDADGNRSRILQRLGAVGGVDAAWRSARIDLTPWAGKTIRIGFTATDGGVDNLVEAGFDDVRIERP